MTQKNKKSSQKNVFARLLSLRGLPPLSRLFRNWCGSARFLNAWYRNARFFGILNTFARSLSPWRGSSHIHGVFSTFARFLSPWYATARHVVFAAAFSLGTMTAVVAANLSTEQDDSTPQQTLMAAHAADTTTSAASQLSVLQTLPANSPASTAPLPLLFDLPPDFIKTFFAEFLDVKALVRLHSAAANKGYRELLHKLFEETRLKVIIEQASINDTQLRALGTKFPMMIGFNISLCKNLTDKGLIAFAEKCSKLQSVSLFICDQITDISVIALARYCRNLQNVDFSYCTQLTDISVGSLALLGHQLRVISLHDSKFSMKGFITLAQYCPLLQELDVSGCEQLTGAFIKALAEFCPNLRELNLGGCKQITDDGIITLAQGCPHLQELDVSGCEQLTDDAVIAIAKYCPLLQELDVSGCEQLTDAAVIEIAQCKQLQELNLSYCQYITNAGIDAIKQHCSNLTKIYT